MNGALIEGKSFGRDTQMRPPPAPEIRFKQEHFHHLVSNDKRSTCKVHLQRVDTFQISHIERPLFNYEDREGPKRL